MAQERASSLIPPFYSSPNTLELFNSVSRHLISPRIRVLARPLLSLFHYFPSCHCDGATKQKFSDARPDQKVARRAFNDPGLAPNRVSSGLNAPSHRLKCSLPPQIILRYSSDTALYGMQLVEESRMQWDTYDLQLVEEHCAFHGEFVFR